MWLSYFILIYLFFINCIFYLFKIFFLLEWSVYLISTIKKKKSSDLRIFRRVGLNYYFIFLDFNYIFCCCCCRVRLLFGGQQGEFKFLPPAGFSPCAEAFLPGGRCRLELPQEVTRGPRSGWRELLGPAVPTEPVVFTPTPVDTNQVRQRTATFTFDLQHYCVLHPLALLLISDISQIIIYLHLQQL